jgi:hypothetical protein
MTSSMDVFDLLLVVCALIQEIRADYASTPGGCAGFERRFRAF